VVITNADIFFDDSLAAVRRSTLHEWRADPDDPSPPHKQALAILRHEFDGVSTASSPIFGPRFDSQDAWVFHTSAFVSEPQERALTAVRFGQPGCDNKLAYLLKIMGFDLVNEPGFVRAFHHHKTQVRDYSAKDAVSPPWCAVVPFGVGDPAAIRPSLGIDMARALRDTAHLSHTSFDDNDFLRDYISERLAAGRNFVIPRVSGIENNFAVLSRARVTATDTAPPREVQEYLSRTLGAMKNNAGVRLSSPASVAAYSAAYLRAFELCEVFAGWEPWGNYIGHIAQSHEMIMRTFGGTRRVVWAYALDVFNYIFARPWTLALRGKRVLFISPFAESIRDKAAPEVRARIYGIDLFPDCEILTLVPPQTHADNPAREFGEELADFCARLDAVKDTYDVALVSCGGYANAVCAHIFESGKSAMYVGGTLQMMWGILGQRWMRETPDVVRLFLNETWTRPKPSERPAGFEKIEGACYF
jgi:hypothetical protein